MSLVPSMDDYRQTRKDFMDEGAAPITPEKFKSMEKAFRQFVSSNFKGVLTPDEQESMIQDAISTWKKRIRRAPGIDKTSK